MGIIIFDVISNNKRVLSNVDNDLLWYEWAPRDNYGNVLKDKNGKEIQGQMKSMRGGKLDFRYDSLNKKMTIGISSLKIAKYKRENNEKDILKWINSNSDLNLARTSSMGISVSFPDANKNAVKRALEDTNFTYEVV